MPKVTQQNSFYNHWTAIEVPILNFLSGKINRFPEQLILFGKGETSINLFIQQILVSCLLRAEPCAGARAGKVNVTYGAFEGPVGCQFIPCHSPEPGYHLPGKLIPARKEETLQSYRASPEGAYGCNLCQQPRDPSRSALPPPSADSLGERKQLFQKTYQKSGGRETEPSSPSGLSDSFCRRGHGREGGRDGNSSRPGRVTVATASPSNSRKRSSGEWVSL